MKKQNFFFMGMILLLVAFIAGCGSQPEPPKDVKVTTYKVEVGNVDISGQYPASIIAKEQVPVRSKASGYVTEKYIHGGQNVTEGQPLFKIEANSYDSALRAAQAQATQVRVAAENAQVDLKRYEILAKNGAVSQEVLDGVRVKAISSAEAYKAAEAQVSMAQQQVNNTVIRAPFSGTLSMDDVSLGAFIAAGQTPLVTIQSTSPVYVEFSMSEDEYLQLNKLAKGNLKSLEGIKLKMSDGSVYDESGHIVAYSKNLDSGSGQIKAKVEFANEKHTLLPGMFATLLMPGEHEKNVLMIPTKSIIQVLDKFFVMVVDGDGVVKQVPIQKGNTVGMFTIVKSGLKAGDEVIVDGLTKAHSGIKVIMSEVTKKEIENSK